MTDRRSYQSEVERLLLQIDSSMHDLRLLKVAGVRGAALKERKHELSAVRAQLAAVVNGEVEQPLAA